MRTTLTAATLAALVVSAGAVAVGQAVTAGAATASLHEVVVLPSTGSVSVHGNGNGHGHGMSQYGARGAAIAGLSTAQILAFYYPGSTLTTLPATTVRVRISEATANTTVFAGGGQSVTGFGALPSSGYRYFRLVPSGSGLALQAEATNSTTWTTLSKSALGNRADFSATGGLVRLLLSDGTSTTYYGSIGALRSGSGEVTINRVDLNKYTQGVVPREMPSSWQAAAVGAQAVAARTYAKSEIQANAGSTYDICDTSSCQVYGGYKHYGSDGSTRWQDDPAALVGNASQVLTVGGAAIFAQFSASNGGATVSGGKSYLPAKVDPYDNAASGDPYLGWSSKTTAADIAGYFGLATATSITITSRDGLGQWGGRVLTATVAGTSSSGGATSVATTGFQLQYAMGLLTNWFHFDAATGGAVGGTQQAEKPSAPTALKAVSRDAGAALSWGAPSNTGSAAVSSYKISYGGHTVSVPGTARSAVISPISQLFPTAVTVTALSSAGSGPAASVSVQGTPAPAALTPLAPQRIFSAITASSAHPYSVVLPGRGGIPTSGATAVQLAITIKGASAAGTLRVQASGATPSTVSAIAYPAAASTTVTVSVPLLSSGTVVLTPSSGSVLVYGDVESYASATGGALSLITPTQVASVSSVSTTAGNAISLAAVKGLTSKTTGVLVSLTATGPATSLRLVPDGAIPTYTSLNVGPSTAGSNTVVIPVSSAHRLRLQALASGVAAKVTVLGLIGTGASRLETFPPSPLADPAGGPGLAVGTTAATVVVAGHAQVPANGASAVLVQVTAHAGKAGSVWVYQAGGKRPTVASLSLSGGGSATATVLVPLGPTGAISLVGSAPTSVTLDTIGYVVSG